MVHKVRPGSISIQLGSWEGKKNRVGNLKGSDIYINLFISFLFFFQNIHFLRQKKLGNLLEKMRFSKFDKICYFLEKFEIFFVSRN